MGAQTAAPQSQPAPAAVSKPAPPARKTLAGGVAHDFNNLLTVILGYGGMMMSRLSPRESDVREDAQAIVDAAERAATLTRQLLSFSRRQVVQPKVISLTALVAGLEGRDDRGAERHPA